MAQIHLGTEYQGPEEQIEFKLGAGMGSMGSDGESHPMGRRRTRRPEKGPPKHGSQGRPPLAESEICTPLQLFH